MRYKSNRTTITYAGTPILQPGQHFAADSWTERRAYTTQATPIIGAASPHLAAHGNVQGAKAFSIVTEHDSPDSALVELLARRAFADANPIGTLVIDVNGTTITEKAGLSGFSASISSPPRGSSRLTCEYSFIIT